MPDKINRIIGIVIIIGLIIFGVVWFSKFEINKGSSGPTPINKIEDLKSDQIPRLFPTQVPIESGAKIISNYNATSPSGRIQATEVFESTKTVSANFNLYSDYLSNNNWKMLTKDSSRADIKTMIAQNSTGILTVTIRKGSDSTKSLVDLSFLAATK